GPSGAPKDRAVVEIERLTSVIDARGQDGRDRDESETDEPEHPAVLRHPAEREKEYSEEPGAQWELAEEASLHSVGPNLGRAEVVCKHVNRATADPSLR